MSQFKFSIITVVKDDEKNILRTLNSVLIQRKNVDLEYIVINGDSSDNTLQIIKKLNNDIDKIISEPDNGIYDAMNKGIRFCSGDIIAFCNSGDELKENGLKNVLDVFQREKCDYVFGTVIRNYTGEKILKYGFDKKRIYFNFDFATAHSCGFYVKKEIIDYLGNYNLKYKCSSDYDFYLRLIDCEKFSGSFTKKEDIVGEVASGGFSSKISFFDHLIEETKIRLDNNQNKILILIIFFNAIFKRFLKKFLKK